MKFSNPMKYRIAALILTITVFAGIGWKDSKHLSKVQKEHETARKEALTLEVELSKITQASHSLKPKAKKAEAPPYQGLSPEAVNALNQLHDRDGDPALRKQASQKFEAMLNRVKAMPPAQFRKFLAELCENNQLIEASRMSWIDRFVSVFTKQYPREGLDIYIELVEKFTQEDWDYETSCAMEGWMNKDPASAIEWVRGNMKEHGAAMPERVKRLAITETARSDRKLAYLLIEELNFTDPYITRFILNFAKTAEDRTLALVELRDYQQTIKDPKRRFEVGHYGLETLGINLAREGVQVATDWATSADLTNSELASFGSDIGTNIKKGDERKWIEWYGGKLTEGKYREPIREVMQNWTQADHLAAGAWLTSAPAGPMKNLAISAFAETVSNYEPEAAVQWAVTLPAGKDRQDTLHQIYHNWPTKDPAAKAAAAAFEKEHNIQHDH